MHGSCYLGREEAITNRSNVDIFIQALAQCLLCLDARLCLSETTMLNSPRQSDSIL
jgi:hypothetical protein